MKTQIIISCFLVLLFSCSKPGQFVINGKITNSLENEISLEKLNLNGTTPFSSSRIDKNGNFKIKGIINQPTFFLLRLNEQKFITLLLDSNEQVSFSADFINFSSDYNIKGSPGSSQVKDLNLHLLHCNATIDSIQSLIRLHAANAAYSQKNNEWLNQIKLIREDQQKYSDKFVLQNPFSLASILAIYQKFNTGEYILQNLQTIKIAASALHSMYPESEHAKTLYDDTRTMMKNARNIELQKIINENGKNSPEISLPNPFKNEIKLSSLRGKYVLLQFWSAYETNCRIQNSLLKENYLKFKPKGFEIYQVSIDTSFTAWTQAIKDDQLTWINVGDMKGSVLAVSAFNISSLPANYLLDPEGNIIARNLFGPALYKKLSEILK